MRQTTGPLHQAGLDPDQAWGAQLTIRCGCGETIRLWDKKCAGCKAKNPYPRLLKKRKKVERWMDSRIQSEVFPKLEKAQVFLESARRYDSTLQEVLRRPFPGRMKKEDINRFMRRVVNFFPAMFKSTSPKQMAMGITDGIKRSSTSLARNAWTECERVLCDATGERTVSQQGQLLTEQAERVATDLLNLSKPYVEALKTLQLAHSRMATAYVPAREIFSRSQNASYGRSLWNKARVKFKPVGDRIRLPTAIWKNDAEREELKRLDTQLAKFLEQIGWFSGQFQKLNERHNTLMNSYKLSLRRYLVFGLSQRFDGAEPAQRQMMVKRVLSHKGIGSFLWRRFFGVRP